MLKSIYSVNYFCNYKWTLNYLYMKKLSRRQSLTLFSLLTFWRTKFTFVLLRALLVSVYPLSKLNIFPPSTSVMSSDLAHQQDASQMQNNICKSVDVFSKHNFLRIYFPLFNITCYVIIILCILLYCLVLNFSLVTVLNRIIIIIYLLTF